MGDSFMMALFFCRFGDRCSRFSGSESIAGHGAAGQRRGAAWPHASHRAAWRHQRYSNRFTLVLCVPCSLPDKRVHFNWTWLQPGMCKGHVLPNLICSIFLTLIGRGTLLQPGDTMTLLPRLMGIFHSCGNANDTVGPRNRWEQFWTFVFSFSTPLMLKVIYFLRDLYCFHQVSIFYVPLKNSEKHLIWTYIRWHLIRFCCFEKIHPEVCCFGAFVFMSETDEL